MSSRNSCSVFQSQQWEIQPPPLSILGDHDVPQWGEHLRGQSIALLVCGGIAAMKAPLIARHLRKHGAKVTAFVSKEALRYVALDALSWSCDQAAITTLSARAEHLGDGEVFHAYLLAPATYNTINKCAQGIADGLITTILAAALGYVERGRSALLIAPTMNGVMHQSILTQSLIKLRGLGAMIIPPRVESGKHLIPSEDQLMWATARAVSHSPLQGRGILVTGGPTPVHLDGVRRLTNKFTGRLAISIAEVLYGRGAEVRLVLGAGSVKPPLALEPITEFVSDYHAYRDRVLELSADPLCNAGVFSAAVADYEPKVYTEGKVESGRAEWELILKPTSKVINEVRLHSPRLKMLTFKYQEHVSHEELLEIATQRLDRFDAVFANRGEERGPQGEQVGWLCARGQNPQRWVGKPAIARGVADYLEELMRREEG